MSKKDIVVRDGVDFYTRLNPQTKLFESISYDTGEVLAIQTQPQDHMLMAGEYQKFSLEDGKSVYLGPGVSADKVSRTRKHWPYSRHLRDVICQMVAEEGLSLHKIARMDGMPPASVLYEWRRKFDDFKEKLAESRLSAADLYADRAMEAAESLQDSSDSEGSKLRHSANKWKASVMSPDVYGNRTKISGDGSSPVNFIIQTGVPVPDEDEKQVEDIGNKEEISADGKIEGD